MNDLHELAEIGRQLGQLQEEHSKAMAAKDYGHRPTGKDRPVVP